MFFGKSIQRAGLFHATPLQPGEGPIRADVLHGVTAQGRVTLDQARIQWDDTLAAVNRQIANRTMGGKLIPLPLCPSACEAGPIAEFLLDIGMDPFQRWNMLYFTDTDIAARILQAVAYDSSFEHDFDAIVGDLLTQMQMSWTAFCTTQAGATAAEIRIYRDKLRGMLAHHAAEAEDMIFGDTPNLWKSCFDKSPACAA